MSFFGIKKSKMSIKNGILGGALYKKIEPLNSRAMEWKVLNGSIDNVIIQLHVKILRLNVKNNR